MDSVTQVALGAAIGEVTLGRRVGRPALLWGGICGLFPDLDVLVPYANAVKAFTYHRGPSHSVFVLTVLTPLFVWIIDKAHPHTAEYRRRWYILVFLAFVTHILLDCLTVYGTQIFWPLPTPPVMWSTIFIVDPVYSIPLFFGVSAALILSRKRSRGHTVNAVCLALSTLYLLWSLGAKVYVTHLAHTSFNRQGISYQNLLTIPAPFNTLLWRVLAMDNTGYFEGYYSLLDDTRDVEVKHYPSDSDCLEDIDHQWSIKRLQWFTHGFYSVRRVGDDIVITDLRMGMEPAYIFRFKVGKIGKTNGRRVKAVKPKRVRGQVGWEHLGWVWQRIWTEPKR